MSGERTPGVGEKVKNHVQGGETVQEVGAMIWTGAEWKQWTTANNDNEANTEVPLVATGSLNQELKFDRARNNWHGLIALESKARTATAASSVITNYNFTKLLIKLLVSANPGESKTLTVSIFPEPGSAVGPLFRFPAVTNTKGFAIAPGMEKKGEGNNGGFLTENSILPGKFIIQVIPSDASSWTYEVTYDLLV